MKWADLETRVLTCLQHRHGGQTIAELKAYLKDARDAYILIALRSLSKVGQVTQLDGVWKLARTE